MAGFWRFDGAPDQDGADRGQAEIGWSGFALATVGIIFLALAAALFTM